MSSENKFFTIMIVPEKTSQVRRLIVPAWVVRTSAVGMAFTILLGMVMFYDYWSVMGQISENKTLKMENRRLRQQVQVFKNKVVTIESTMERVKTFATRLKVITNIEDRGGLLQTLNQTIPDATSSMSSAPRFQLSAQNSTPSTQSDSAPATSGTSSEAKAQLLENTASSGLKAPNAYGPLPTPVQSSLGQTADSKAETLPPQASLEELDLDNPEDALLQREYDELDQRFSLLNHDSLFVETMLQDLYELLGDQKAFLTALPTRKPAVGYFTSGFGVRKSPIGGKVKMHEGLDIANHLGTPIRAPADGVVTFAQVKAGYGQTVILDHGYGLETWYGHAKKILVTKGQRVHRGETIAQVGNSGRSTGPHVHYEVRVNGYPVNPLSYILEN